MPIVVTKAIKGTSLGTAAADTQLGGATQKAPEWAREFLAFKTGGVVVTPTSTEAVHQTFRVASNDFSCYPSSVPSVFENGAVATTNHVVSQPRELWPCNWPIHGGDAYDVYAQSDVACTAAPYADCTVYFGDGEGIMSSRDDPYPHLPRFHWKGASVALAATAQALTSITITGAKAITELNGYVIAPTMATAARPEIGRIQLNSNGFFTSPIEFNVEPINGGLGTILGVANVPKISRERIEMPCSPTTIINPVYYQDNATAVTTSRATAGVTFIR